MIPMKKSLVVYGMTALLLPLSTLAAEDNTRWESGDQTSQTLRTRASDTRLYYDAGKVERDGKLIRFKLYTSESPSDQRVAEEVTLNCDTHEMVRTPTGSKPVEASKLFAGEAIYGTARELCGWGAGFWKRLAD